MFALELVAWWYGAGWRGAVAHAKLRLAHISDMFSVPILLRTLFAPWRRIITYPGKSINDKFKAISDNAVSRLVGFLVRLMALLAAGVLLISYLLIGLVIIVLWPLVPLLGIGLIIWGVV
jgi:hypothetical protein